MDIIIIILLVVILGMLLYLLRKLRDITAKIDLLLSQQSLAETKGKVGALGADKPTQPIRKPPTD